MTGSRPSLSPIFRSDNQLRLLALLLLAPGDLFTVGEIAARTGVPQPSVSREVAQLVSAGLLVGVRRGRHRLVGANIDSAVFPELSALVRKVAGPAAVVQQHLAGLPGVEEAYIYGSWAARYAGQAGHEPRDVDVVVIGTADVRAARDRAEGAGHDLGREVSVSVLTRAEWSAAESGFVRHVRASPLVPLDIADPEDRPRRDGAVTAVLDEPPEDAGAVPDERLLEQARGHA